MIDWPYDDAMIDRCCLYLLGELSPAEAAEFEQQLAASDELRSCLAEQAELLAELGMALATGPFPQSQPLRQASSPRTESPPNHERRPAPWILRPGAMAAALALAASLLIWVGVQRSPELTGNEPAETLQLAQAWAAERSQAGRGESEVHESWTASQWPSDPWEDVESPEPVTSGSEPLASGTEPAADEPGPPQWLIIAVQAMEAEESEERVPGSEGSQGSDE